MIWRVTVRLFYIEDARSLKVKIPVRLLKITDGGWTALKQHIVLPLLLCTVQF